MKLIIITAFLFFNICGQAQSVKKNIAWFYPTKVNQVNGILLSAISPSNKDLFSSEVYSEIEKSIELDLKVNGLDLNIDLLSLVVVPMIMIHSIDPNFHEESYEFFDITKAKKINGLQIGFSEFDSSLINGLDINIVGSFNSRVNGISITPLINKDDSINGLSIAGLGNYVKNCNGLQISLFNSCDNLKGVQLGLWNSNQKRRLPFINWNFKR